MPEKNYEDHREFERHPIDFTIEVSSASDQEKQFCDKTRLNNISGGGVCFATQQPELYCAGQHVSLKVFMPGTDDVDASMQCQAKVVWIHHSDQAENEGFKRALIGVCLDGFMSFERRHMQNCGDSV